MKAIRKHVCIAFVLYIAHLTYAFAQGSNTVGGYVFGPQRTPLEGITIDLLDDYSRSLGRTRTDSTGRFLFSRLAPGRYRVRTLSSGTYFQEQEKEIEIQNFSRTDSRGNRIVSGFESAQVDFYLQPIRGEVATLNEVVFVQEVPTESQQLYDQALHALKEKRTLEGYAKLRASIESFPDYFMAISVLGLEYVQAEHYEAAAILLQKAAKINPKNFKVWFGLASALKALNLNDSALDAAQNALKLSPSSVHAMLLTGILLRQSADYPAAETMFTKIKKQSTVLPEVHWQLALLYGNNLKRYGDAADELEQFLKYLPKDRDPEQIKSLIRTFREKVKKK